MFGHWTKSRQFSQNPNTKTFGWAQKIIHMYFLIIFMVSQKCVHVHVTHDDSTKTSNDSAGTR